jgi:hypothetical protein
MVPVLELTTPRMLDDAEPLIVRPEPLIVSVFPLAALNVKQLELPGLIDELIVSVRPPVETVNDPPAIAVVPAVVRKLLTVISWSIVTALPLA